MIKINEILFVDDVPEICTVFKNLLEARCGVHVTCCHSANEALAVLEIGVYDLLITDILMPGMDGIELTNIVLKKYNIPIVLTTGYQRDDLPMGFDKTDAVCCLAKPYSVTEICAKIEEAIVKKVNSDRMKSSQARDERVSDRRIKPIFMEILF